MSHPCLCLTSPYVSAFALPGTFLSPTCPKSTHPLGTDCHLQRTSRARTVVAYSELPYYLFGTCVYCLGSMLLFSCSCPARAEVPGRQVSEEVLALWHGTLQVLNEYGRTDRLAPQTPCTCWGCRREGVGGVPAIWSINRAAVDTHGQRK